MLNYHKNRYFFAFYIELFLIKSVLFNLTKSVLKVSWSLERLKLKTMKTSPY